MKERPILFSGPMVRAILDGRKTMTRRVVKCGCNTWHINRLLGAWGLSKAPHQLTDEEQAEGLWRWQGKTLATVGDWIECIQTDVDDHCTLPVRCPYAPGDRLWVKETWMPFGLLGEDYDSPRVQIGYKATNDVRPDGISHEEFGASKTFPCTPEQYREFWAEIQRMEAEGDRWHPSIFMPRWASRITLEVTAVRVERLQEITEDDAKAEGMHPEFELDVATFVHGNVDFNKASTFRLGFKHTWDSINGKTHPWASNPWVWVVTFRKL